MENWKSNALTAEGGTASLDDRRTSPRYALSAEGTHLWLDDDYRIAVDIIDESNTGIGIRVPGDRSFELGPRIRVEYNGERRTATVAYLNLESETGFYRLGLQWVSS